MTELVLVELLDGSWLGVNTRGADRSVAGELAIWALVPDHSGHDATRSEVSWEDVRAAGSLLTALRNRRLTDAAWRAFDSTARHLSGWWAAAHSPLSTAEVADRVGDAVTLALESPDDLVVTCAPPVAGPDGSWSVRTDAGATAICAADGLHTQVWFTRQGT